MLSQQQEHERNQVHQLMLALHAQALQEVEEEWAQGQNVVGDFSGEALRWNNRVAAKMEELIKLIKR